MIFPKFPGSELFDFNHDGETDFYELYLAEGLFGQDSDTDESTDNDSSAEDSTDGDSEDY